jgi:hypothetical protein
MWAFVMQGRVIESGVPERDNEIDAVFYSAGVSQFFGHETIGTNTSGDRSAKRSSVEVGSGARSWWLMWKRSLTRDWTLMAVFFFFGRFHDAVACGLSNTSSSASA